MQARWAHALGAERIEIFIITTSMVATFYDKDGNFCTQTRRINGIGTEGPGELDITDAAFPNIEAGSALDIRYQAKVAVSEDVKDMSAATVIFTIASVD